MYEDKYTLKRSNSQSEFDFPTYNLFDDPPMIQPNCLMDDNHDKDDLVRNHDTLNLEKSYSMPAY